MTILAVTAEAARSARSAPVVSGLIVLIAAGLVGAVMLTSGRAVAAEEQLLATIDSTGTRTIVIRADVDARVSPDTVDHIERLDTVTDVAGFGPAGDATNSLLPDGLRVPVRTAYGRWLESAGLPVMLPTGSDAVYVSSRAQSDLGLRSVAGTLSNSQGIVFGVSGAVETPAFLSGMEPLAIQPRPTSDSTEPLTLIVIVVDDPSTVAVTDRALAAIFEGFDSGLVNVETSSDLAELRASLQSQLGDSTRDQILLILAMGGVLVSILVYGTVLMRRKDFGRRRALGATRQLIIGLVLTQTWLLATIGAVLGAAVATTVLAMENTARPSFTFTAAVGVLMISAATAAATIPAIVAGRREPIRELRVP